LGEDKKASQQVVKENFIALCNNNGIESPASIDITCTDVEIVSSTQHGTMTDQVLIMTIFGLEIDVNAFVSAVGTSGLDMKVYGDFSVYVTATPTTSPEKEIVAPETTLDAEGMAANIALCSEFESAGIEGVLYTNIESEDLDCATQAVIATEEEKRQFHEDVKPMDKPLWVFSSTDQASEALAQELRDLSYWTVTSLGGLDGFLGQCTCKHIAIVEVDTVNYTNEVAGAVIFAIICVLICCTICYCVKNRDEYFPVEDRPVYADTKTKDVKSAGASSSSV